jgi:hypothetical protein
MRLEAPGGDIAIFVWSLRWVAYAVAHLQNPFYSDWLNYPAGVNLLDNTTVVLLGVMTAPVTLVFGAIVSYNLLQTLAFATSALAAFALLRRWTSSAPAAFAGGLLYGFSPYMISANWGHIHQTFAALIPLIVMCLDEILVRQQRSPVRWGLGAGVLAAAQFLISSEMLADIAELSVLAIIVLAVQHRADIRANLRHAVVGLLTAISSATLLLAYPIWFTLAGPQHGSVRVPVSLAELYSSDLLEPIVPTSNQLLSTSGLSRTGDRLSGGLISFGPGSGLHQVTNAGYLGLPLLLILLFVTVRYWRVPLVRLFAPMSLIAFVLALGPALRVDGHLTGIDLPERLIFDVPLLNATLPLRYGLFYTLGAAILLAVGIDRFGSRSVSDSQNRLVGRLPLILILCALVPLIPKSVYGMREVTTPRSLTAPADARIPAGSVALTYPPPGPATSVTMEWQAADFRYRMVGAYMFAPVPGQRTFSLLPNQSITENILDAIWAGQAAPPLTRALRATILGELSAWRVRTVIVATDQPHAATAIALFSSLLGHAPRHAGGTATWTLNAEPRSGDAGAAS